MTDINHVKRFKIGAVDRYMKTFSHIATSKMFNGNAEVFACQHFAERLVDRNLNHELAVKILSFAFENYPEKFLTTVDSFIRYKDVLLLVNSIKNENVCKIRLNTMIYNNEDTYIKSKVGVKTQTIDIELKQIMNYVPKSMNEESKKKNFSV